MKEILKKLSEFYDLIYNFYSSMESHITNDNIKQVVVFEQFEGSTIDEVTEYFFSIVSKFELLCLYIVNDADASTSLESIVMYGDIGIEKILQHQDVITYTIYKYVKDNKPTSKNKLFEYVDNEGDEKLYGNIIPSSKYLFQAVNSTILLPSSTIVSEDEVPKTAKKINYSIENTHNIIFDAKSLIDMNYIVEKYPDISVNSGLNPDIIARFSLAHEFENTEKDKDKILEADLFNLPVIYQYLGKQKGKKYYRELLDYPTEQFSQNYGSTNMSLYMANFENKRISMLRKKNQKKFKKKVVTPEIHGLIKNHFYQKKQRMGAAVVDSVYSDTMLDGAVLNLFGCALNMDNDPIFYNHEKIGYIRTFADLNDI